MDVTKIPLFNMMQQKMLYHSHRQSVLAQNVANADTPGYMARDIREPDFAGMIAHHSKTVSVATTQAGHIQPGMGIGGGEKHITRENTYELNPIGNNVTIEEEMMRVADNQSQYQQMLSMYRKSLEMFKIALGKPNG